MLCSCSEYVVKALQKGGFLFKSSASDCGFFNHRKKMLALLKNVSSHKTIISSKMMKYASSFHESKDSNTNIL